MEWTRIDEDQPPTDGYYFIAQEIEGFTYYYHAVYSRGVFIEPYYGQEICDAFNHVTHWMKPEPPKR